MGYSTRIFGLDLLRAFAILTVVYGHGNILLEHEFDKAKMNWFTFDGVSIFFVLSGFLIGGILIKQIETGRTQWSDLFRFWRRRWFRTLPNYFLVLTVLTCYYVWVTNRPFSELLPYFGFLQNFAWDHPIHFNEAWSLSVEEWFYLGVPLLMWSSFHLFALTPRHTLILVALIILTISGTVRIWRFLDGDIDSVHAWDLSLRKQVVTRLDSIMIGVIAAYIKFYRLNSWFANQKKKLFAGIGLIIAHKVFIASMLAEEVVSAYDAIFSFWVIALGTALTLPYLSNWKVSRSTWSAAITKISLISYSMYLIHLSGVLRILVQDFGIADFSTALGYLAYWFFTFTISWLMYRFYEKPTTALREKF
ncbi:MAG: acyltransferase [Bacteroidetes bacterium]|nr:MAG: acyltransferase [Bacteroidota bacterium]